MVLVVVVVVVVLYWWWCSGGAGVCYILCKGGSFNSCRSARVKCMMCGEGGAKGGAEGGAEGSEGWLWWGCWG